MSVDGQKAIRTCANGSSKYHRYQDIEAEVAEITDTWLTKKLVATTVSSGIVGIKRLNEMRTMSSHEEATLCKDQEDERMKGKGGGRQRFQHVDGDVPLCMRHIDEECDSKLEKKEKVKGKGGGQTMKARAHAAAALRRKMRETTEENDVTFVVL